MRATKTDRQLSAILKLRAAGVSWEQIGRKLDISSSRARIVVWIAKADEFDRLVADGVIPPIGSNGKGGAP